VLPVHTSLLRSGEPLTHVATCCPIASSELSTVDTSTGHSFYALLVLAVGVTYLTQGPQSVQLIDSIAVLPFDAGRAATE
jgi:hypothetical protein